MTTESQISSPKMTKARVTVLTVLLIASIAGAWGYSHYIHMANSTRGAEMIDQINQRGVGSLYGRGRQEWWVIEISDHQGRAIPVGWRVSIVRPNEDGTIDGWDVKILNGEQARNNSVWERWRLNDSATEGLYLAGPLTFADEHWSAQADTAIAQSGGELHVTQTLDGEIRTSQAPAPDNYLPEGARTLAIGLMAQRDEPVKLTFVANGTPPKSGRPDFRPVTMRQTRLGKTDPDARAIQITYHGVGVSVHYLDRQNEVDRVVYGGGAQQERRTPIPIVTPEVELIYVEVIQSIQQAWEAGPEGITAD